MTLNPYFLLFPAFLTFLAGSYVSYSDQAKARGWFLPVYMICTFAGGLFWYWAVNRLPDKPAIYVYSLVWDALMVFSYYIVPAVLFLHGSDIKPVVILGLGMMLLGLVIVKLNG